MHKVTVLMAVYNGMPYLPAAIESILNQTFDDFEFLIINDCSTDQTRDVILGYEDKRIRLVDNKENIKQTRSLNKGLELATSEFIARMDADDISHPERFKKQYDFLIENPNVAVVGSSLRLINENGKVFGKVDRFVDDVAIRWMQFFTCPIANGAAMFRKSVIWDELGGYDSSIKISQDWDLWSRIPYRYSLANLSDYLLDIRTHDRQETKTSIESLKLDDKKINLENSRRLFGQANEEDDWAENMELLLWWEVEKRKKNPEKFVRHIETLYEMFCEKYPSAPSNSDVCKQLVKAYVIAINCSSFRHWRTIFKVLAGLRPHVSNSRYLIEVLRWLSVSTGGRRIKNWLRNQ